LQEDNILCMGCNVEGPEPIRQMCLPVEYRTMVYGVLHTQIGHFGAERVIVLAKDGFHWPGMAKDITHFVRNMCQCIKDKKPAVQRRAEIQPIRSTYPFELISMFDVYLERSRGGCEYMLNHII
jgi:hypothetical protein